MPAATTPSPLSLPPGQARLVAALVLSLALHLAVLFLVRVIPTPRPPAQAKVLQVRLAERSKPTAPLAGVALDAPRALRRVDLPVLRELPEAQPDAQPAPPRSALDALDQPQPPAKPSLLPTLDMPLVVDPTYYTSKEVDVHPEATLPVQLAIPDLPAADLGGWVVLRLLVEEDGTVSAIGVVDSQPPGVFDAAALQAFRTARFSPAQRNGRVVKAEMLIRVDYERKPPASDKQGGESRGR